LVSLLLVVELAVLFFNGVKVNMSGEYQFILTVNVFPDPLELLLELLNVLFGMRVHFLEDGAGPLERIDLVRSPLSRGLLKFDLRLDDVELLFQLLKFPVVYL